MSLVSIRGLDLARNFNKTDMHPILINSNSSHIHTGLERVPLEQAQPEKKKEYSKKATDFICKERGVGGEG